MADDPPARPRPRTLAGRLQRLRRLLRTPGRKVGLDVAPSLPEDHVERVRAAVADLLGRSETTSRRAAASRVADTYVLLDDVGRRRFLAMLTSSFGTDPAAVDEAMARVQAASTQADRAVEERRLRRALRPPVAGLLRSFTGLESGVKLLVDLRADVRRLAGDDPAVAPLEAELVEHLTTLFDVGLLQLRRITWDSPAALLEKLIAYEAVHAIHSWGDLKNRLGSDRRCYAFFHPAMPGEPIVFVEVALTRGLATHLAVLLDESAAPVDPSEADTAIFYSITSCQPGLAGVNLGNELIKQVVDELARDLPTITGFSTLSPIPGFRAWLEEHLGTGDLTPADANRLGMPPARVLGALADDGWADDADLARRLEHGVLGLCARYVTERRGRRVRDPVANFHLSNGASVERLTWLADPGPVGLGRSVGIMANYRYDPATIAANAEAYAATGEVALSGPVRALLPG